VVRCFIFGFLVLALAPLGASATCVGPKPAIGSVYVASHTSNGRVNVYNLVGTVTNVGSSAQSSNTLQFVDIWQYGVKLDARGIPPLGLGSSAHFSYAWQRAIDAAPGTTTLNFTVDVRQGINCSAKRPYTLTF